jgi:hypothetical protein
MHVVDASGRQIKPYVQKPFAPVKAGVERADADAALKQLSAYLFQRRASAEAAEKAVRTSSFSKESFWNFSNVPAPSKGVGKGIGIRASIKQLCRYACQSSL